MLKAGTGGVLILRRHLQSLSTIQIYRELSLKVLKLWDTASFSRIPKHASLNSPSVVDLTKLSTSISAPLGRGSIYRQSGDISKWRKAMLSRHLLSLPAPKKDRTRSFFILSFLGCEFFPDLIWWFDEGFKGWVRYLDQGCEIAMGAESENRNMDPQDVLLRLWTKGIVYTGSYDEH